MIRPARLRSRALLSLLACAVAGFCGAASAQSVSLTGMLGSKALLVVEAWLDSLDEAYAAQRALVQRVQRAVRAR